MESRGSYRSLFVRYASFAGTEHNRWSLSFKDRRLERRYRAYVCAQRLPLQMAMTWAAALALFLMACAGYFDTAAYTRLPRPSADFVAPVPTAPPPPPHPPPSAAA
eukprot:tig00000498_g1662.t1